MDDTSSGVLALVFAILIVVDICLVAWSYVYSRFIFSRYLKKNHEKKWEELARPDYPGFYRLGFFDRTEELRQFRCDSDDDLGDPEVVRMRRISITLFRTGLIGWMVLAALFLLVGLFCSFVYG